MPDGSRAGPYTSEAVRGYVADGRIPVTAYVVQEATGIQMALSRAGFVSADVPAPDVEALPSVPPAAAPRRDRTVWIAVGVVVAVILLLIGLGVAVFATWGFRSRSTAVQAACLSNIKQLSMACLMYATDWNDTFPTATDPQGFQNQIMPYVQNAGLFVCPDAPNEPGYVFNPKLAGKTLKSISQPANTPMLWDAGARPGGVQPAPGTTTGRHNGSDNVSFADGHAKRMSAGGISGLVIDPFAGEAEAENAGAP
jgi:prepilin-type processing-associated H-X9-DG protein